MHWPAVIVGITVLAKVKIVPDVTVTVCSPSMAAAAAVLQPPVPAVTPAMVTVWPVTYKRLAGVVTVTVVPLS